MLEIVKLANLKPLEMVFPSHLDNLSKMIMSSGVITSPIIADKKTGIVLDGSHRYVFFLSNGYTEAPVIFVNYMDENIRVGTHLMHRHIIDGEIGISKDEVVRRGLNGDLFPPRTTRNFFPFRKNAFSEVELSILKKGNKVNVDQYILQVDVQYEIDHNTEFLNEIDHEIDEIIRYLDEIRITRLYLKKQIEGMKK